MKKGIKTGRHRPVIIKTKKGWKRPIKSRYFHKPVTLEGGGSSMSGLPKKYAKFGFKRGWAMFKKRGYHGKRRKSISGDFLGDRSRKRSKKVRHAVWLDGDFTAPALLQRPVNKIGSITPKKILSPVIDLLLIMGGMIIAASTKKIVPIKNPHLMNGANLLVGVGGSLLTKNRFAKMPLLGMGLQSTIAEAKILMPKMVPLAGDDDTIYLPVGDDGYLPEQVEFSGTDDRMGSIEIPVQGEDDRVGDYFPDMEGEDGESGE
jgi:hypothetical protein